MQMIWAGYKRAVPWAEVLCHTHKHGNQIQALKKKLYILIINNNAQYTTNCRSYTLNYHSVYHGHYISDLCCAELSLRMPSTRS